MSDGGKMQEQAKNTIKSPLTNPLAPVINIIEAKGDPAEALNQGADATFDLANKPIQKGSEDLKQRVKGVTDTTKTLQDMTIQKAKPSINKEPIKAMKAAAKTAGKQASIKSQIASQRSRSKTAGSNVRPTLLASTGSLGSTGPTAGEIANRESRKTLLGA